MSVEVVYLSMQIDAFSAQAMVKRISIIPLITIACYEQAEEDLTLR